MSVRSIRYLVVSAILFSNAIGCGGTNPIEGVLYDETVSAELKESIERSYSLIDSVQLDPTKASTQEFQSFLESENVSNKTLRSWLDERAKYYVGPDFVPQLLYTASDSLGANVLMQNLGAALMIQSKTQKSPVHLKINYGILKIKSPRVGIIQAFDYFNQAFARLDPKLITALQTSILIHEARHSDGHGKNLGFPHTTCHPQHEPTGNALKSEYHFKSVCDTALNGSYAAGVHFLKAYRDSHPELTPDQLTNLNLLIADFSSRTLRRSPRAAIHDSTPESL